MTDTTATTTDMTSTAADATCDDTRTYDLEQMEIEFRALLSFISIRFNLAPDYYSPVGLTDTQTDWLISAALRDDSLIPDDFRVRDSITCLAVALRLASTDNVEKCFSYREGGAAIVQAMRELVCWAMDTNLEDLINARDNLTVEFDFPEFDADKY